MKQEVHTDFWILKVRQEGQRFLENGGHAPSEFCELQNKNGGWDEEGGHSRVPKPPNV